MRNPLAAMLDLGTSHILTRQTLVRRLVPYRLLCSVYVVLSRMSDLVGSLPTSQKPEQCYTPHMGEPRRYVRFAVISFYPGTT